jgi:hypothetical protein
MIMTTLASTLSVPTIMLTVKPMRITSTLPMTITRGRTSAATVRLVMRSV